MVVVKQRLLKGPADAVNAVENDASVDNDDVFQQRRSNLIIKAKLNYEVTFDNVYCSNK